MPSLRRTLLTAAATVALAGTAAAPASAIVGGRDAAEGQYPAVASITLGGVLFSCTGTLIAPTWVLTAGHCGSLTGAAVSSPIAWPAPLIDVRLNSITAHQGDGEALTVKRAIVPNEYIGFEAGYDITLLELSAPATVAPVPISGPLQTSLWAPGTLETIVGFGVTEEDGSSPAVLQVAEVPTISDADCAAKESSFNATTMLCAGFAAGGIDTCQGDSGGPIFGRTGSGALRVVGATSFGSGCARPDVPGVYARVGDTTLRSFVAEYAPEAIDGGAAAAPAPAAAATTSTKAAAKKKAAKKKAAKKKAAKKKAAKKKHRKAKSAKRS